MEDENIEKEDADNTETASNDEKEVKETLKEESTSEN